MSAPARVIRTGPRVGTVLGIVGAVTALVIVATVAWALTRPADVSPAYLSPTSGSDSGVRAALNVLRDQGVDVIEVDTFADLRDLDLDADSTTIAVWDGYLVLDSARRTALLSEAHRLIALGPGAEELADFAPGIEIDPEPEAFSAGPIRASCDDPVATRAEEIDAFATAFDLGDSGAVGCFPLGESPTLVVTETAGTEVVVLGATDALTNGWILRAGNAAFTLGLLGQDATLVWYTPSLDDLAPGTVRSPRDVTPPWVTPLMILLGLTVLLAAVWRGRRFGPLVRERLPVLVRSSETLEGRARLYERAGARSHALDGLRAGTRRRLAASLGLSRRSSLDELVTAVSALTGRDRDAVAALLEGGEPATDRALVAASDALLRLETEVADLARAR